MPIMKTAIALKKAASGDVFEVVCDDAGFDPMSPRGAKTEYFNRCF
jgi:TusA-related sulfurtransferase